MPNAIIPTDREVFFRDDELIVSKTDLKGRLTYVNRMFCDIADYSEPDLLSKPHSIIRHPDMPRAVFKLLWDTLGDGREIFAYVKNMTRVGDYYWVLAHVTPSYDQDKNIVGYHSNRRVPNRDTIRNKIVPLYGEILQEERRHRNGQQALAAGTDCLGKFIKAGNKSYDALIFSL